MAGMKSAWGKARGAAVEAICRVGRAKVHFRALLARLPAPQRRDLAHEPAHVAERFIQPGQKRIIPCATLPA